MREINELKQEVARIKGEVSCLCAQELGAKSYYFFENIFIKCSTVLKMFLIFRDQ